MLTTLPSWGPCSNVVSCLSLSYHLSPQRLTTCLSPHQHVSTTEGACVPGHCYAPAVLAGAPASRRGGRTTLSRAAVPTDTLVQPGSSPGEETGQPHVSGPGLGSSHGPQAHSPLLQLTWGGGGTRRKDPILHKVRGASQQSQRSLCCAGATGI